MNWWAPCISSSCYIPALLHRLEATTRSNSDTSVCKYIDWLGPLLSESLFWLHDSQAAGIFRRGQGWQLPCFSRDRSSLKVVCSCTKHFIQHGTAAKILWVYSEQGNEAFWPVSHPGSFAYNRLAVCVNGESLMSPSFNAVWLTELPPVPSIWSESE